MKRSMLDWIALILVIIGAVNWGLIGIGGLITSNLNIVNIILGSIPLLENIVYILVGLAGLYTIYYLVKK